MKYSAETRQAYQRGRRQGQQDFAGNERKLLRLTELLMTYGDVKFGEDEWRPSDDNITGEEGEISELLDFAAAMQEARLVQQQRAEHEAAGPEHTKWCPGPVAHRKGGQGSGK